MKRMPNFSRKPAWGDGPAFAACLLLPLIWSVLPCQARSAELIRIAPGRNATVATAVSADGLTAAGYTQSESGTVPFRWSVRDGFEVLPAPAGKTDTRALGVSTEGDVLVGYTTGSGAEAEIREAFYWSRAEGVVLLGDLPEGRFFSEARAASARGEVIVGYADGHRGREAFVWRRSAGLRGIESLDTYPDNRWDSMAIAVSGSGFTVAGQAEVTSPLGWPQTAPNGFIWREGIGLIPLVDEVPDPDGSTTVEAMGSSGFWLAGVRALSLYRWNEVTGFETIVGAFEGNRCVGISSDGERIAGYSGGLGWFVWENAVGAQELKGLLAAGGADVLNWDSLEIQGMSADGTVLCGVGLYVDQGVTTEAWVARVDRGTPTPPTSLAATFEGSHLVLSWEGRAGWTYQLQTSSDFNLWTNVGAPIAGTGAPTSAVLPPDSPHRFARVLAIRPVSTPF